MTNRNRSPSDLPLGMHLRTPGSSLIDERKALT